MIEKIISGGQTGADRAALDAAIALGIAHGGWVPKGRLAEDGPLPETYALREMPSAEYRERTVQNVVDSDGTLIISRGPLTGGSATTMWAAQENKKACLHIDLNRTGAFSAAAEVVEWLMANRIGVLNVAGPRASKDPKIYADVRKLVESVYYLGLTRAHSASLESMPGGVPEAAVDAARAPGTLPDAVDYVIRAMTLKDRAMVANMTEREVLTLEDTLGRYIGERLDAWASNSAFVAAYYQSTGRIFKREEAVPVLLRELWRQLKSTHRLRLVK